MAKRFVSLCLVLLVALGLCVPVSTAPGVCALAETSNAGSPPQEAEPQPEESTPEDDVPAAEEELPPTDEAPALEMAGETTQTPEPPAMELEAEGEIAVQAEAGDYTLKYRYDNALSPMNPEDLGIIIMGYTGTPIDLVIPDEINDAPVRTIYYNAFSGCSSLKSVVIPDTVTMFFHSGQFSGCVNLESVTLSGSLEVIAPSAFSGCSKLANISWPANLRVIGEYAFRECAFASITLPSTVQEVDRYAFSYNKSLVSFALNEGLDVVQTGLFRYCINLESVSIPSTAVMIGHETFQGCENLTPFEIPPQVYFIGDEAFKGCKLWEELVLPATVTSIGHGAFMSCLALRSVDIRGDFEALPYSLFAGCTQLSQVTLPAGLEGLGADIFNNCSSLEDIELPDTLKTIYGSAFYRSGLKSITLPDSLEEIKVNAFGHCYDLESAVFYSRQCNLVVSSTSNHPFIQWKKLTIYGYEGSTAQAYAKRFGIPFGLLEEEDATGPLALRSTRPATGSEVNKTRTDALILNFNKRVDPFIGQGYIRVFDYATDAQMAVWRMWGGVGGRDVTYYNGNHMQVAVNGLFPMLEIGRKYYVTIDDNCFAEKASSSLGERVWFEGVSDKDALTFTIALPDYATGTLASLALTHLVEHGVPDSYVGRRVADYVIGNDFTEEQIYARNDLVMASTLYNETIAAYTIAWVSPDIPCVVFTHPGTGNAIVAFANETDYIDLVLAMPDSKVPGMFTDAMAAVNKAQNLHPGKSVSLAGSGMGGTAAAYCSLITGRPATLFNASADYALLTAFANNWADIGTFRGVNAMPYTQYGTQGGSAAGQNKIAGGWLVEANANATSKNDLAALLQHSKGTFSLGRTVKREAPTTDVVTGLNSIRDLAGRLAGALNGDLLKLFGSTNLYLGTTQSNDRAWESRDTISLQMHKRVVFSGASGVSPNRYFAGQYADVFASTAGNDVFDGGYGKDTYVVWKHSGTVTINDISNIQAADVFELSNYVETMISQAEADKLDTTFKIVQKLLELESDVVVFKDLSLTENDFSIEDGYSVIRKDGLTVRVNLSRVGYPVKVCDQDGKTFSLTSGGIQAAGEDIVPAGEGTPLLLEQLQVNGACTLQAYAGGQLRAELATDEEGEQLGDDGYFYAFPELETMLAYPGAGIDEIRLSGTPECLLYKESGVSEIKERYIPTAASVVIRRVDGRLKITVLEADGETPATPTDNTYPVDAQDRPECPATLRLPAASTYDFGAYVPGDPADYTWASTSTDIANFEDYYGDGVVLAKQAGTTTVTAKDASDTVVLTCEVTVFRVSAARSYLSPGDVTLHPGQTQKLELRHQPSYAMGMYGVSSWVSNNPGVADVGYYDGLVTAGNKYGTATITARNYNYETIATTTVRVTPSLQRAQPLSLALAQRYVVLQYGESFTLKATAQPADALLDYTLTDRRDSVVSVDPYGHVTAGSKAGRAVVRVAMEDDASQWAECHVEVVAPSEAAMAVYSLDPATVTFSTKAVTPATFTLWQKDGYGQRGGLSACEVRFADKTAESLFEAEALDDRSVTVRLKDGKTEKDLKKPSYKSKLELWQNDTLLQTTKQTLTLKVNKKLPSLKATAVSFNIHQDNNVLPLQLNVAGDVTVRLSSDARKNTANQKHLVGGTGAQWVEVLEGEAPGIRLAKADKKRGATTLYLEADLPGWAVPVPFTVKVSAADKKPGLKLSAKSLTLPGRHIPAYTGQAIPEYKVQFALQPTSKKDTLKSLGVVDLVIPQNLAETAPELAEKYTIQDKYEIPLPYDGGYNADTGTFTLKAHVGDLYYEEWNAYFSPPASGTLLLAVKMETMAEWQYLILPIKVAETTTPYKVTPAKSTVTINGNPSAGDNTTVALRSSLGAMPNSYSDVKVFVGKKDVTSEARLTTYVGGNSVYIGTTTNTKPGTTYRVQITWMGSNSAAGKPDAKTNITVKTTKSLPSVTLTAKGKLDLSKTAPVTITASLKNRTGNLYTSFAVTGPDKKDVTANFDILRDGTSNRWRLTAKPEKSHLIAKGKYTITPKNASVSVYDITSVKSTTFTVTASKPKVSQSAKTVTLYKDDTRGEAVFSLSVPAGWQPIEAVAIVPTKAQVKDPELVAYHLDELGGGRYSISYLNGRLSPGAKNATLTLSVRLKGAAGPITNIKVKVVSKAF